jgi:dUTP pyrophosphatase
MATDAHQEEVEVKLVYKGSHEVPTYKTALSAGMDVHAEIDHAVNILPLERSLIPTALYVEIPAGYEIQVRPRSGLAYKHGISILNSPGTIDADYRGEIGVIVVNLSNVPYTLEPGERIAQLVLARHARAVWKEADSLSQTERGSGGFGSTGIKKDSSIEKTDKE